MIRTLGLALTLTAAPAFADTDAVIDEHVLPRMDAFVAATEDLAAAGCAPGELRPAFADAATAWAGVRHLALGPTIEGGRDQAVLFWPDDRDAAGRGLRLLQARGEAAWEPATIAQASVAARGLGALERLIYDADAEPCPLTQALADDLVASATTIRDGWRDDFAETLRTAGAEGNTRFLSEDEATAALYTALTAGLERISEQQLGRPLGAFDAPRPLLAELRRSEMSVPMIAAALDALAEMAGLLADAPRTVADIEAAAARAETIGDPSLAQVADPPGRIRVEAVQTLVRAARETASAEIGADLGVSAGFNAADGD